MVFTILGERMDAPKLKIDFSKVRSLNESPRDGFEELTVQLFKRSQVGAGEFVRIEGRGGDGGVEAYIKTPSGKIGFQSKLIRNLEASQWKQLTESVQSAIRNHSDLHTYVIAAP